MRTAYLVGYFALNTDTTCAVLELNEVGIYSESANSLTLPMRTVCAVDLAHCAGEDYDTARRNLLVDVAMRAKHNPGWNKVKEMAFRAAEDAVVRAARAYMETRGIKP